MSIDFAIAAGWQLGNASGIPVYDYSNWYQKTAFEKHNLLCEWSPSCTGDAIAFREDGTSYVPKFKSELELMMEKYPEPEDKR
jgi:hypothetical protein